MDRSINPLMIFLSVCLVVVALGVHASVAQDPLYGTDLQLRLTDTHAPPR